MARLLLTILLYAASLWVHRRYVSKFSSETLINNIKGNPAERKIGLSLLQGIIFVSIADIVRCEANAGYTWFHFTDREKVLVTKTLGEYESLLSNNGFVRVYHASLINCEHIVELKKGTSPVSIMSDGSRITVSQRKREALFEYIQKKCL